MSDNRIGVTDASFRPDQQHLATLKEFALWICKGCFFFMIATVAFNWTPFLRDDSDDGLYGSRSFMMILTDYKTGCQYLKASNGGGLTPRLTSSGKHMGCRSL